MSDRMRKTNRASFGSARKLPSGRWQARYVDEAGRPMTAPSTFETKRAALDHLAAVQADRLRGSYIDHRSGARPFGDYARAWIAAGGSRGKLAPRTAELYVDILDHQLTRLEAMPLNAITGPTVRDWYAATRRSLASAAVKRGGTGETRLRQSYALLRAVMATAVNDRLIAENPARIVGAGVAKSPERPHLDAPTFARIVSEHPADYRPCSSSRSAHTSASANGSLWSAGTSTSIPGLWSSSGRRSRSAARRSRRRRRPEPRGR